VKIVKALQRGLTSIYAGTYEQPYPQSMSKPHHLTISLLSKPETEKFESKERREVHRTLLSVVVGF
jgi:hypothetical protein